VTLSAVLSLSSAAIPSGFAGAASAHTTTSTATKAHGHKNTGQKGSTNGTASASTGALGTIQGQLLTTFATTIAKGAGSKVGGIIAGWALESLLGIGNGPSQDIENKLKAIQGQLDAISGQIVRINENLVALNESLKAIAALINTQADYALYSARVTAITTDESVIETAENSLTDAMQAANKDTLGQKTYLDDLQADANNITSSTTGVQVHVNDLVKLFLGQNGTQSLPTLFAQVLRNSGKYPEFDDRSFYTDYINPLVENYASYVVLGMNLLVEAWHLKYPNDTAQSRAKSAVTQDWALLRAMNKAGGYPLTNGEVTTEVASDGSVFLWTLRPLSVTAGFDSSQAVDWANARSIPVSDAWLVTYKAEATKGYMASDTYPNGKCAGLSFLKIDSCVTWDFKKGDTISKFPATYYRAEYGNAIVAANTRQLAMFTLGTTLTWALPSEKAFIELLRSSGQQQPKDYLASVGFTDMQVTMMGSGSAPGRLGSGSVGGYCQGLTTENAALAYAATYPNIPCLTKYEFNQIPELNPVGPAKFFTSLIAVAAVPTSSYMGAGTLNNILGAPTALCNGTGPNDANCRWLNGRWPAEPIGPGANLSYADLKGTHLASADLKGANLMGADLQGADLTNANLVNANLTDANLKGAKLEGADVTGANMTGTIR
jgi:hypothetical protein